MKTKPVRNRKDRNRRRKSSAASIFAQIPELKHARALWLENKRLESVELFAKIVEDNPSNIPSLIDASRAFGKLFNYQTAREYLETVKAVGARSASASYLAGQTYRMIRDHQSAESCLSKAIKLDAKHADARLELAIILERQGRLDEAMEQAAARNELLSGDSESVFLIARIQRRRGDLEHSRTLLQKLVKSQCHPTTKARAHNELAAVYDLLGEYEAAWGEVLSSQIIRKKSVPAEFTQRRKRLDNYHQLASELDCSRLEHWQNRFGVPTEQRSALLTGLPRSGTTLLAALLHRHEQVFAIDEHQAFAQFCLPLMLGSYSPDSLTLQQIESVSVAKITETSKLCRSMMAASVDEKLTDQILINKNPSLLPILVPYLAIYPHSPVLTALRDPRDVLISCLFTYMPVNDFTVDMLSVSQAVERIQKDLGIWTELREKLPAELWLEVKYENLIANKEDELQRTFDFLGLPGDQIGDGDSTMQVNSPSYEQAQSPLFETSINRWKNYTEFLSDDLEPLQKVASSFGY